MSYQITIVSSLMLGASLGLNFVDGNPRSRREAPPQVVRASLKASTLRQEVDRLAVATWPQLLNEWNLPRPTTTNGHLRSLIKERLIELDPAKSWDVFENMSDRSEALHVWMQRDPQAAVLALAQEGEGSSELIYQAGQLASVDALESWKALLMSPMFQPGLASVNRMQLRKRAVTDPVGAADAAVQLGEGLATVLSVWCQQDSESAWQWMKQLKGDQRQEIIKSFIASYLYYGQDEPLIGADRLFPELNEAEQEMLIGWLAERSRPSQLSEVVTMVNRHVGVGERLTQLHRSIAKEMAERAPKALAELVTNGRLENVDDNDLVRALRTWLKTEPEAVMPWLQSLEPGNARRLAWTTYIKEVALSDLAKARALFDQEVASDNEFQSERGQLVGFRDERELETWLESIHPDRQREELNEALLYGQHVDPDLFAAFLSRLDSGQTRTMLTQTLLQKFPAAKAAARAHSHVDAVSLDGLLNPVMHRWASEEPLVAAEWLEKNGSGRLDLTYETVIGPLAQEDPMRAIRLAAKIQQPARLESALAFVLEALHAQSPGHAFKVLKSLALPESIRSKLAQEFLQTEALVAYFSE